ncbi:helix-turn-helix domain-containing protein [Streptacidiphilus sp. N1-3]|uniref:Helix-turn-helix domain-containing protein n=1 Tax=Streptacidiphilus alkalitolerans TaxID=3342712 RepID=A0ABV6X009_9ACTN
MAQNNLELADFLKRARGKSDPTRAGLPPDGRVRRVPGLQREEVALLAGVSSDYYARLEQGRRIVPSPAVVQAIGRALGLDAAGQAHLEDLIGTGTAPVRRRPATVQRLRPGVHQLFDSLVGVPALALGRRTDILAANRMAKALFTDFDAMPPQQRNYARWMFLDKDARVLFVDWEVQARAAVESLRLEVGRDPHDPATLALLAELRSQSAEFDQWWEEHRVYQRTHGSERLLQPLVGELTVEYETITLPGDRDTALFLYTAQADSPSRQALDLLASWALGPANADRRDGPGDAQLATQGMGLQRGTPERSGETPARPPVQPLA